MALINEGASLPSYIWAVVRFLLAAGGSCPVERARAMLCPPSLLPKERDETFNQATATLRELGLAQTSGEVLSLGAPARQLAADGFACFSDLLREAALSPDHNASLSESDDQTGPKDLTRALAWFLTRDPLSSLGWAEVAQAQVGAFASHLTNPFVNGSRWDRFVYWAPVLGLAAQPVLDGGSGQRLMPDCTAAVRRIILAEWENGQPVDPAELVDRVIDRLPVLPGGRYSRALGLYDSSASVSSCLSFALLCGDDQGWIALGRPSDAAHVILADPDATSGLRRVGEVTVQGSLNG